MIDPATMQQAMNGDRDAFAKVVTSTSPRLTRFAASMVNDREAARDIVQDVFVKLWTSRTRYRSTGSVEAYLLKVVRNACIDNIRSRRLSDELDDVPSPSCEARVLDRALGEAVAEALMKLPEPQRLVFVLSEREGMTYQEIADLLGCPHGTVASRKSAAMEGLRKLLRPWMEGTDEYDRM